MNFIAGNLLYHAEEYLGFWLLVMLFEQFELRDIYMPSFLLILEGVIYKYKKNRTSRVIETLPNSRPFNINKYGWFIWKNGKFFSLI